MQQTQTAEKTVRNQNKQFFRIHIKPNAKPYEAIKGKVYDNEIQGETTKVFITPPEVNIHNFYKHKVIKLENAKGVYEGRFKFVDSFDSTEGVVEEIEVRYIENCPSLDKQWQIKNGYKPKDAKAYHGWNYPANEVVEFEVGKTDPLFIEFIKHHQGSASNPNRDPRNGVLFVEVNADKNISNKKAKFEMEKKKTEFIENIYTSDEIVTIYSEMLGIPKRDIDTMRDSVLDRADKLTTDGMMKEVNNWKAQYRNTLGSFLSDGKISVKNKKVYIGKNPEPYFKDVDFKSESGTETITEIAEKMFTTENVYEEVKKLLRNIK